MSGFDGDHSLSTDRVIPISEGIVRRGDIQPVGNGRDELVLDVCGSDGCAPDFPVGWRKSAFLLRFDFDWVLTLSVGMPRVQRHSVRIELSIVKRALHLVDTLRHKLQTQLCVSEEVV